MKMRVKVEKKQEAAGKYREGYTGLAHALQCWEHRGGAKMMDTRQGEETEHLVFHSLRWKSKAKRKFVFSRL